MAYYHAFRQKRSEPKCPLITAAKLRFFKQREAAARRQQRNHGEHVWFVSGKRSSLKVPKRDVNTLSIVSAVITQQRRNLYLGIE